MMLVRSIGALRAVRRVVLLPLGGGRREMSSTDALDMEFETPEIPVVPAAVRFGHEQGSRQARALRKVRQIPGIIFGKDNGGDEVNIPVKVYDLDVGRLARIRGTSLECTLVNVTVDSGKEYLATPRGLQLCPLTQKPLSMNYWIYRPGNKINVPFSFYNADLSVDLKRGSYLRRISKTVDVICDRGVHLPSSIPVNLAGKVKGDVIKISDVQLPEGVLPHKSCPDDLVVAKVSTSRGK